MSESHESPGNHLPADFLRQRTPLAKGRFWYTARGYALSTTFSRLARHKTATLMTLLVIGISLSLPAFFVFVAPQVSSLDDSRLKAPGITTYLSLELDDLQGARLAEEIRRWGNVKSTQYLSKDEALQSLQSNTSLSEAVTLLGENPLPGSIIVQPATTEYSLAAHRLLAQQLESVPGIAKIQQDLEWVKKFQALTTLIKSAAALSAVVLIIASLMVIANTIRLELLRHARESKVCHLLGATPAFTRRPFIYLGAVYGFAGACVASIFGAILIALLDSPVQNLARSYASDYELLWPSPAVVLSLILGATLLGMLASILTVARPSAETVQQAD